MTYQSKGQLDDSIGPVVSVLEAWLLAADGEEHVIGSDIGLAAGGSAVGIGRLGVGDIATGVDVGERVVVDLEGGLDLDVSRLGDDVGSEVLDDAGGGLLACAVDL